MRLGQTVGLTQRSVWFDKLPKIFNWYETIINKFTPVGKAFKYVNRIGQLKTKIYWEIRRCPEAGIDAQEQAIAGLEEMGLQGRSEFFSTGGLEFDAMVGDLERMMVDSKYLIQIAEDFEYEIDDDFQNPILPTLMRGRRRKKKKGKNAKWVAVTDTKNRELGLVQEIYTYFGRNLVWPKIET